MAKKMRNWLVLFSPETPGETRGFAATVDKMKVIDAWQSDGSRRDQIAHMLAQPQQVRYVKYHGEGVTQLVESDGKKYWL